jgi:AraC-like DNA-binding protein
MDVLADIFRQAGLRRRLLNQRSLLAGVALRFPCERSIGFHVVTEGELFIHGSTAPPLSLRSGDVAFMARGQRHVVSADAGAPAQVMDVATFAANAGEAAGAPRTYVVSGAYQFWNDPVHPLFKELPEWFVLRAESRVGLDHLQLAIALLARESADPGLGSENVMHAMLDVVFLYLLRRIVADRGQSGASWCHAIRDPQIRSSVELMHEDYAADWSLDELARRAGMSRAGYAAKFRDAMGSPPLHYLRIVRMQRAVSLLSDTQDPLERVANAVGYRDAFGFSKVFKKIVGVSPREFRSRDHAERKLAFRI